MLTLKELKKIVKVADMEKRIPSVKSLKEHKVVVKEMINSKDAFFFHSFFINIGFIFIFQLLIRVGMQLYCFIYIKHWKF